MHGGVKWEPGALCSRCVLHDPVRNPNSKTPAVPPKICPRLAPVKATLCGNKVFALVAGRAQSRVVAPLEETEETQRPTPRQTGRPWEAIGWCVSSPGRPGMAGSHPDWEMNSTALLAVSTWRRESRDPSLGPCARTSVPHSSALGRAGLRRAGVAAGECR